MNNIKHIKKGYTNLLKFKLGIANKDTELKAKKKIAICNTCEYRTKANFCGACTCLIIALVRSDKKCAKGFFT